MSEWWIRGERFAGSGLPPRIMGVLNLTPDSFSDGGKYQDPQAAVDHALQLVEEGADILDVGGESSRPGAEQVSLDEERRRVLPVLEILCSRVNVPISIDTMKPQIAREALACGVKVINDISGLRDPEMLEIAAAARASVVLMHMAGTPQTMQNNPVYEDVVKSVSGYLEDQVRRAELAGIPRANIAIDPGVGFGKRTTHNLEILRQLPRFASVGCVLLIGVSRKGLIGTLTDRSVEARLTGSIVASLAAIFRGAGVVRVHDVGAMRDAIRVWDSLIGWRAETFE